MSHHLIQSLVLVTMLVTLTSAPANAQQHNNDPERPLQQLTVSGIHPGVSLALFYDPEMKTVAVEVGEHLSQIYASLASVLGVDPAKVKWSEVALVRPGEYIPPRTHAVRWPLVVNNPDQLEPELLERLYFFIAHEQTHAVQKTAQCASPPRWFIEGHASWAEFKVGEAWKPELAIKKLADEKARAATTNDPLNLSGWGGVRVKRSAIYRQVSARDQEQMDQDPNYFPKGPFKLESHDFISDESNTQARYHQSHQLFLYLEQNMGRERFTAFTQRVLESEDCSTPKILDMLDEPLRSEVEHWLNKD